MIRHSVNPYDARKWIEDCCYTESLIGHKIDGSAHHPWIEGAEYTFAILSAAYVEWQKGVKSPVAPAPTPAGSLGKVLSDAGFGQRKSGPDRFRMLPNPVECLAKLCGDEERDRR
jgi:hypothetical protein